MHPASVRADFAVGFEVLLSGEIDVDWKALLESSMSDRIAITSSLFGFSDRFEFEGEIAVSAEGGVGSPNLDFGNITISFYPFDNILFRLGYFEYRPGFGEFSSPTSFFIPARIEIPGPSLSAEGGATLIFQGTFLAPLVFATLTAAPVGINIASIDPESRWFPTAQFPTDIPWPFPPYSRSRRTIMVAESATPGHALGDISLGVEFGASLSFVDLTISAYRGEDRNTTYTSAIHFPSDSATEFDIMLSPEYSKIFAIGIDATASIGPVRLWTDTSITFDRLFAINRLSVVTFETLLDANDVVETVSGASVEFSSILLSLLLEYRGIVLINPDIDIAEPFLGSVLVGSSRLSLATNRLFVEQAVALSTKDLSSALYVSLALEPSDQIKIRVGIPLFVGDQSSEFGQFSDHNILSASVGLLF